MKTSSELVVEIFDSLCILQASGYYPKAEGKQLMDCAIELYKQLYDKQGKQ